MSMSSLYRPGPTTTRAAAVRTARTWAYVAGDNSPLARFAHAEGLCKFGTFDPRDVAMQAMVIRATLPVWVHDPNMPGTSPNPDRVRLMQLATFAENLIPTHERFPVTIPVLPSNRRRVKFGRRKS